VEEEGRFPVKNIEYYSRQRLELLALIPKDTSSILDVGCGSGMLGRKLREENPNVHLSGIEINATVAPFLHYDEVYVGDVETILPTLLASEKVFDCLVFADVLEHLIDPWKVMDTAWGLLHSGGTVIVSTPNIRNYGVLKRLILNGEWEYESEGIMDRTHLRFFTAKSIRALLELRNFVVMSQLPIRYPPERGWKKVVDRALSLSPRFRDMGAFQFITIARKIEKGSPTA